MDLPRMLGETGVSKNMKQEHSAIKFAKLLDAALEKRKGAETGQLSNVVCEVCGDNIRRYIGPISGIVCHECMTCSGVGLCTRHEPLAITRSSLNE